jgi:hypothetical protein
VVVSAHTEWVEAQGLLTLTGYCNHDGGPFDLVRVATGQPPIRVEQYLKMRPGIDMMPAAPVLRHRLLHSWSLHHIPPFSRANNPAVIYQTN